MESPYGAEEAERFSAVNVAVDRLLYEDDSDLDPEDNEDYSISNYARLLGSLLEARDYVDDRDRLNGLFDELPDVPEACRKVLIDWAATNVDFVFG
jgi:hypothetical protein